MSGPLHLTREGTWLHEGMQITNEAVALYFHRRVVYSPDHACFVVHDDAGKCVAVEVEDTGHFVRSFDTSTSPWWMLLSTEAIVPFTPECIYFDQDQNSFYCDAGGELARLLKPAIQTLLPYVEGDDNGYFLNIDGKRFPFRSRTLWTRVTK